MSDVTHSQRGSNWIQLAILTVPALGLRSQWFAMNHSFSSGISLILAIATHNYKIAPAMQPLARMPSSPFVA